MQAKAVNLLTFIAQLTTARLLGTMGPSHQGQILQGRWVVAKHARRGGPFLFRSAKGSLMAVPFPYSVRDKSWQVEAAKRRRATTDAYVARRCGYIRAMPRRLIETQTPGSQLLHCCTYTRICMYLIIYKLVAPTRVYQ